MTTQRDPRLLYGADIRKRILDDVAVDIDRLGKKHRVGRLVSVGIGDVEEIAVYIRGQARAAAAVGLPFDEQHWPAGHCQNAGPLGRNARLLAALPCPT